MTNYKIQILYDTNNSKLSFLIYENDEIRVNPNLTPVLTYINNKFDMSSETLDYSFVNHLFELIPTSNEITLELKTNLSILHTLFTEQINKVISEHDKFKKKKVTFIFSNFADTNYRKEEKTESIIPSNENEKIDNDFLASEYSDYEKALSYYFEEVSVINHPEKNNEALELLVPLAKKYPYNNSLLLRYFHILIQENLDKLDFIKEEINNNFSNSLQAVKLALIRIALIQQNINEAETIKNEIENNYNDIISLSYCSLVYLALYSKTQKENFFIKAEELVSKFEIKKEQDKFENSWIYLIQNLVLMLKEEPIKNDSIDSELVYKGFCSTNYSNVGFLEDCAYRTILDAINANNENQVIYIYPGTYNESFVINHQVQLIGKVKEKTILMVPTDASLEICGDCILKNFIITNNKKYKENSIPEELQNSKPIMVISSNCKIDSVDITEARGNAIEITSGSPKILNCKINNNACIGIIIKTETLFTNSNERNVELYSNASSYNFSNYGFSVGLGENPTIEDCSLINNQIGISYSQYSKGSIISSEIKQSKLAGIKIEADSYPIINNCQFINNECGIEIKDGFVSSGVKAQYLYFENNRTDFTKNKEAKALIDINTITHNDSEESERITKTEEIKSRISTLKKKITKK